MVRGTIISYSNLNACGTHVCQLQLCCIYIVHIIRTLCIYVEYVQHFDHVHRMCALCENGSI